MRTSEFQSTRPRGARLLEFQQTTSFSSFQSTRPRGARRGFLNIASRSSCFNPRARVGRDVIEAVRSSRSSSFQSTRPRGARLDLLRAVVVALDVSIHAPAWGATSFQMQTSLA